MSVVQIWKVWTGGGIGIMGVSSKEEGNFTGGVFTVTAPPFKGYVVLRTATWLASPSVSMLLGPRPQALPYDSV